MKIKLSRNIIFLLLSLFATVCQIDYSKAQVNPMKDRVIYWPGTLDTISPRIEYDRWTGYLMANETTHQLTFRDPVTGLPSIGSSANLPISTAQTAVNTLKAPLASPALTGAPTAPTPSTSSGIATKGYVDAAITAQKRMETYSGVTAGSGTYTVTYAVPFSVKPVVIPYIEGGAASNNVVLTSSTTTGFTVTAYNLASIIGLLPNYVVANGLTINVLVREK